MSGQGRGRGLANTLADLEQERIVQEKERFRDARKSDKQWPLLLDDDSNNSAKSTSENSSSSGEKMIRGRGGFRHKEPCTMPEGITETRAVISDKERINIMANFIPIEPMSERIVYQYRVDIKPNVEAVSLRRQIFKKAIESRLPQETIYDGWSDARSAKQLGSPKLQLLISHPSDKDAAPFQVTIRLVGQVCWRSQEMTRVYNMNMRKFMQSLGFFRSPKFQGGYLHPLLSDTVRDDLRVVRGFKTAVNQHMGDKLLICLESVSALFQTSNVLNMMMQCRQLPGDMRENIKTMLVGKTITVNYKRRQTYKIEDVHFDKSPESKFYEHISGADITYIDYYKTRYNLTISDKRQPLLLAISTTKRRSDGREVEATQEIYIVPEFCNIAGLTSKQQSDFRLRTDLIRASQITPQRRVDHMYQFLSKLKENREVQETLAAWGYSYGQNPVKIRGRHLPVECVGVGENAIRPKNYWTKMDNMGGFELAVTRDKLAKAPAFHKLAIVVMGSVVRDRQDQLIMDILRQGFAKIGLDPKNVEAFRLSGDHPQVVTQTIRTLPPDVTAAIIIIRNQNKELYDSIKKLATSERGLVTQVVTAKLMTDERKARGAAVKIGIQVAAKIGGEPWYIDLPLDKVMVCGYDTHKDTTLGKSFGAFLASMNHRFSRWWSTANRHSHNEELSNHLSNNMAQALNKYREQNNRYPERVFLYRDGVGDGDLDHVFNVELVKTKTVIKDADLSIKFTVIIVNKEVGARFYMHNGPGANPQFVNPPPGTVIDDVVTRKDRYDFYLISQSTRNGTISPTYYNIVHDESGLPPARHQAMAFKMCSLYYNWTGTVKVPAPCQYAHKLAYLCGEHLHQEPSSALNDRLHFL